MGTSATAPQGTPDATSLNTSGQLPSLQGLANIQHVIVIVQENRSFDHYFGTFPRGRRAADEERTLHDMRARPRRGCMRTAVSRHRTVGITEAPMNRPRRVPTSTAGGWTDPSSRLSTRVSHARSTVFAALAKHNGPHGQPDVMRYHDPDEDPELLAYAVTSCCRTVCSPPRIVDTSLAPLLVSAGWSPLHGLRTIHALSVQPRPCGRKWRISGPVGATGPSTRGRTSLIC